MSNRLEPMVAIGPSTLGALLGIWLAATPLAGDALGLRLPVSASVEIVDHVLPGLFVVGAAVAVKRWATLVPIARRATFAAGWWVVATHVPLVAADGLTPTTVWHALPGLGVVCFSLARFVQEGGSAHHLGSTD